jgi:hypothetical protein
VATNKEKEGDERLYQNQAGNVQKIRSGKCMLETEAIFQIEIGFGAAKVGNDLNARKCQASSKYASIKSKVQF